jgi:Flp pilus assembly protein TadG
MFMVTRKLRRWRDRGAAAVEFALVLPLLVMILFGIMEFGYAFLIQAQVAGAARVGVRSYAINWNTTAAQDTAAQNTAIAIAKSQVPVPADASGAFTSKCVTAGSQTTLTLTYQYHSLTGLLDGVLGPNIKVTVKGSMACGG